MHVHKFTTFYVSVVPVFHSAVITWQTTNIQVIKNSFVAILSQLSRSCNTAKSSLVVSPDTLLI